MPNPTQGEPVVAPQTSSVPSQLPAEQEALFREVLEALEAKEIPLAVSGAFALQLHTGICRDTKDLDIFLCAEDASAALACLQSQGFECEVPDPVWLAKARRDGFFVDLITGMSNAVITVEKSWIKHAHPAVVFGVQSRVLAPEELIASKIFVTRRERFDGADIAHVIYGTKGKLDWDRLLQIVGTNWEMLLWDLLLFRYVYPAQTHFVPATLWEDLLTRMMQAIARPDGKQPFRGSLVDDCMFAIDLKEWGLENVLEEYRAQRSPKIELRTAAECV